MRTKASNGIALCAALAAQGLAASFSFAQGCASCYTQAAGSGSRMIAALRGGILLLMVPPLLMSLGICWMAYKKRNQFNVKENIDL
jgi:hypothetical protein